VAAQDPFIELGRLIERARANKELVEGLGAREKYFQFRPTDGEPFYLTTGGGKLEASRGEVTSPTATIVASSQDLSDLFAGRADAFKLFFSGRLRVQGNVFEAQELAKILGQAR
jgi:putative sterol carrier protein